MIMRAKQEGNVVIFELEGHLEFETTQQFQQTCSQIIEKNGCERVVFNLEKLKFVGSSGINQFVQVIKSFNSRDEKPKLVKLSTEFDKIFRAYEASRNPFDIFAEEKEAIAAFDLPKPAKKTSKAAKTAKKKPRSN